MSDWDDVYRRGLWDYLSTDVVEFNRLRLAAGWIDTFGAASVMDIGCGKGQLLKFLNVDRVTAYVAIDASQIALDQIAPRPGIELSRFCLDAQAETPPQSCAVDCICFIDVLQYCERPAEIVKSYARHLRPNGLAVTCHYIRPERVQSPPIPGADMYTETDAILEQQAIDKLLDSVVLISPRPEPSRRWHMKAFSPRRGP